MNKKLISFLVKKLKEINEDKNNIKLNLEDKESMYDDLIIPLMNLMKSDNLNDLQSKLNILINDQKNEDFKNIANDLINYILSDEKNTNSDIYEEINNLIMNCIAINNTFSDKKVINDINNELIHYINTNIDKTKKENDDEDVNDSEENSDNQESESENNNEDDEEPSVSNLFKISNSAETTDDTPQIEVDKIELKNLLKSMYDESADETKENIKNTIDEIFALVKSYDKSSDWQYPHHTINNKEVFLNINGLKNATLKLLKPSTSKVLTTDERSAIATHLLKHYNELKLEKPEKLEKISNKIEKEIVINLKEDELKEYAKIFNTTIEDLSIYVGLFESVISDFINNGIIDIQNQKVNTDTNVITLSLSKEQIEEFVVYFDNISDDVLNILKNDFNNISHRKTDKDLESKMKKSENLISELENKINELTSQLAEQKVEYNKVLENKYDKGIIDTKFGAIVNFIKSTDNIDEGIINVIDNVIEADSEKDIKYLCNIGKSFISSKTNSDTLFVKKTRLINKIDDKKIDELLDIVGSNKENSKDESSNNKFNRIEQLAENYL